MGCTSNDDGKTKFHASLSALPISFQSDRLRKCMHLFSIWGLYTMIRHKHSFLLNQHLLSMLLSSAICISDHIRAVCCRYQSLRTLGTTVVFCRDGKRSGLGTTRSVPLTNIYPRWWPGWATRQPGLPGRPTTLSLSLCRRRVLQFTLYHATKTFLVPDEIVSSLYKSQSYSYFDPLIPVKEGTRVTSVKTHDQRVHHWRLHERIHDILAVDNFLRDEDVKICGGGSHDHSVSSPFFLALPCSPLDCERHITVPSLSQCCMTQRLAARTAFSSLMRWNL